MSLYFQGIAKEFERGMDWFEESATRPIVMITRNGEVGTPRLARAREQLETLQGNRGLPTSPCHRSSFKMPSNCEYDSSNFLYL